MARLWDLNPYLWFWRPIFYQLNYHRICIAFNGFISRRQRHPPTSFHRPLEAETRPRSSGGTVNP